MRFAGKMAKTWLCFLLTIRTGDESWSVKSAGESFGIKTVWFAVPQVQVARAQHADSGFGKS